MKYLHSNLVADQIHLTAYETKIETKITDISDLIVFPIEDTLTDQIVFLWANI